MTRIVLLIALAILTGNVCAAYGQSGARTLTLDEAIDIAIRNNRSAKNAQLEADRSSDKLAALKTRRLPGLKVSGLINQPLTTFDTTFEQGVFGTYQGIGPIPSETTSITSSTNTSALMVAQITQPITQLKRIGLQIKQQELAREISDAARQATNQTIVNEVKRAYYAILQTQGAADAAEEAVKLYKELDRVTGEYVVQQVALKTDQMNVQTKLAEAEYHVMSLKNVLSSQKEQLNNLLGRDVGTEFVIVEGFDTAQVMMRETSLTEARQRALQQRPEVREARLRMQQAALDVRAKKTEFIPDVSLTLTYASTFNYSNFVPRSVTGLGVQIEWEVFDWGRRKHEVAEKARVVSEADNDLQQTQNQVVMEVNNKFRTLQESCQMIRIARLAQTAARADVQMVSYKYRLEAVLLKDVLQAQTTLADANANYQKALLSFWTAKADFEKALGENR